MKIFRTLILLGIILVSAWGFAEHVTIVTIPDDAGIHVQGHSTFAHSWYQLEATNPPKELKFCDGGCSGTTAIVFH